MAASYDFRNEEDVKQYLHNIGIEYRFGCYSEKKPEVCHLLGMYLMNISKNLEQAKKVYKVNCDTYKFSYSCYKYAYLRDQENKESLKDEIIDYYNRGCESGLNKSCYMAGVKLGGKAENDATMPNRKEAIEKAIGYMDKACDDKLGEACFNLSSIYFNGVPEVKIPQNLQKFFEYSVKACDALNVQGCANTSLMYAKGEVVPKNEELAKKYRNKADELYNADNPGLSFDEGL